MSDLRARLREAIARELTCACCRLPLTAYLHRLACPLADVDGAVDEVLGAVLGVLAVSQPRVLWEGVVRRHDPFGDIVVEADNDLVALAGLAGEGVIDVAPGTRVKLVVDE